MKFLIVAVVLVSSAYCAASTKKNTTQEPSCPVQILRSSLTHRASRQSFVIDLRYGNQAQEKLVGEKFGLEFLDSTGDWHPYFEDLSAAEQVKVKSMAMNSWDVDLLGSLVAGYRITLKKLAFSDGTTWEDDGTQKCIVSEDFRATH